MAKARKRVTRTSIAKRSATKWIPLEFEKLENRQVLAAIFPTFVDGVFTLGDATAAVPYALADTFKLETNPTASKTIYLDFDGHLSANNGWGHNINFPAFDTDGNSAAFSDAELIEIQKTFQHVAEDYSNFDVNVTTMDPGLEAIISNGPGDTIFGMRCVMTQEQPGFGGFGGVAFLNSFGSDDDTPCFVLNKGVNVGSMSASHEVGHTFGLRHDGLGTQEYHPGIGTGATSWGPIMGAPFFDTPGGANSVQWSKGDYTSSTNSEDDYTMITSAANGVTFKVDDFGNTLAGAGTLDVTNDTDVFDWGFITTRNDVDVLRFQTGDGPISLTISPFEEHPNLDISAQILDETGSVIASSNPADQMNAAFTNLNLTNGTYYLRIDGVGNGNNENVDYGSTGFYSISGVLVEPIVGPQIIGESGLLQVSSNWKTVEFTKTYTTPVVIAGPASLVGADPLTIRIRNVTHTSFQIALDEWDYRDGIHGNETVSYMVMEAGSYVLTDGTVIQAGSTTTNHRWSPVAYSDEQDFTTAPVVFAQITTYNEIQAATARISEVSSTGFRVRVQEEQNADFVHKNETVSWIAISKGNGVQEGLSYEVDATPNEVTHLGYSVDFDSPFSDVPAFFANMQTFNGGDPATVRSVRTNRIRSRIFLEEERSFDAEIRHNPEVVGYFAIEPGQIVIPPVNPNIPQMISAPRYRNNDDPARLAAALEVLSENEANYVALDCACDSTGGCSCASCVANALDDQAPRLANFVFGFGSKQAELRQGSGATDSIVVPVSTTSVRFGLAAAVELQKIDDEPVWSTGAASTDETELVKEIDSVI